MGMRARMTLLALSLSLLVAIVHAAELHNTDLEDLPAVRRQLAAVIPTVRRKAKVLIRHSIVEARGRRSHFKTGRAMMKASKAMQQTLLSARKELTLEKDSAIMRRAQKEQAKHEADDTMAHVIDTVLDAFHLRATLPSQSPKCRELQQEVNWLAGNMTTGDPACNIKADPPRGDRAQQNARVAKMCSITGPATQTSCGSQSPMARLDRMVKKFRTDSAMRTCTLSTTHDTLDVQPSSNDGTNALAYLRAAEVQLSSCTAKDGNDYCLVLVWELEQSPTRRMEGSFGYGGSAYGYGDGDPFPQNGYSSPQLSGYGSAFGSGSFGLGSGFLPAEFENLLCGTSCGLWMAQTGVLSG